MPSSSLDLRRESQTSVENQPDLLEPFPSIESQLSPSTQDRDQWDEHAGEGNERERALIERMDRGSSLSPGLDPDIELLMKRTGSLQFTEQGQLKYFGTTSNVHFLRTATPFHPHLTHGDTPESWLDRAGVGHTVPREVEDHLIRLYFAWENPYFNVVEQDVFMNARRQALSEERAEGGSLASWYSDLLVNAMCSWGALFTDTEFPGLPSPLHDFFISRARALLERDIDNPTIATVQALAMMSGSEASRSRDSRGWLYDSMAAQLAHHLGLHLDVEHYIQSNDMSRQEGNVRSTAFWGTYVIDLAWSYYLGRLTMPVADVNRVPVRMPDQQKSWPPQFWDNYTNHSMGGHIPVDRYIDPVSTMWEYHLKLCFIMERLQRAFYDKHTGSITQLQAHTSAATTALETWLESLPPILTIDTTNTTNPKPYLPRILVLHTQYHEAMIFANHPFITMPRTGQSHDSRRKYIHAAREITRIAQIYDKLWSLRRINIQGIHHMFTASMVHLYIACTSGSRETHARAVEDLEICCTAIRGVSKSYWLAVWQLRSIDRVRQVWYEMLESHSHAHGQDQDRQTQISQNQNDRPDSHDRWAAIEAAIQKAMVTPNGEGMLWFDTWMQMQSISVDPFAMGVA
ncbi:fungal specific transcription factor [Aspergillus sclerotialis]|uniref:Fungal specific transcription factor n=1 Tax=Aspergillus sclerotialis TaxID=2070753 RepID=A0A3A2ZRB0_9EURO|nr:fungal specific transcription factor [Aspergillus sclerotialis]